MSNVLPARTRTWPDTVKQLPSWWVPTACVGGPRAMVLHQERLRAEREAGGAQRAVPREPADAVRPVYREKTGLCPRCHPERGEPVGRCYPAGKLYHELPLQECEVCQYRWLEGDITGLVKPERKEKP